MKSMNKTSKHFLRTRIRVRFAVPVLSLLIPIAHTSHILDGLADKGRYITSSPQTRTQPQIAWRCQSVCDEEDESQPPGKSIRMTRFDLQGSEQFG